MSHFVYKSAPEEQQYLDLIQDILVNGSLELGRNGNTFVKFGHMMRFSLDNGQLPLLTTKRVAYKACLEELLWFLRGQTDARLLQERNVHIWDGNASREFLDNRGLTDYPEGILGPIYGFQWRHFGATYCSDTGKPYPNQQGIDQLKQVIDQLKDPTQRSSRRILMSAWNPLDLDKMALPPCHVLVQFHVSNGTQLSCALYQRSCDIGLGVPFNIASYSLLTHLLAKYCGLEAKEFVYFMGNAHIYESHIPGLRIQQERDPLPFPRIQISDTIKDFPIENITAEDISFVTPYEHDKEIKLPFVA
jgi:thymidylate synthase